jgi:hypothetical protein
MKPGDDVAFMGLSAAAMPRNSKRGNPSLCRPLQSKSPFAIANYNRDLTVLQAAALYSVNQRHHVCAAAGY